MNRRLWTGGALAAFAAALSQRSLSEEKPAEKDAERPAPKWVPHNYTKVLAYRFGDISTPSGSLISNSVVATVELDRRKLKTATLSEEQTGKLLSAATGGPQITDPFGCYNPHHIFLFLDATDHISGAMEVCFGCRNVVYLPAMKLHAGPDFRALAKLCEETVGLVDGRTAADFIKDLDEEEKRQQEKAPPAEAKKK